MIRPPRLRPGDLVRIVAPSGPVSREAFERGAALLGQRYRLRFDEGIFARQGYLAGPDERRLAELRAAVSDPEARGVIMARGGYGLLRLLPLLDPDEVRGAGRLIVGFSDGTALLALAARAGVVTVHGPVVTQLGVVSERDRQALFQRLEDPGAAMLFHDLEGLVPGRAQGPLIGGNLEVFSRLVGTPWLPDVAGAILFFEDLGERPYRVDRLITALDLAGVFAVAAGVVIGDFSRCLEPEATRNDTPTAEQVLEERLGRLAIPVAWGAAIGHGDRNVAVPYGGMVELDAQRGTLIALEGAVS